MLTILIPNKWYVRYNVYPKKLQLNIAIPLDVSITNDIFNFPFLDGDVPRRLSNDVYISQLNCFAGVCSYESGFNKRNQFCTAK